ncbi:Pyrazinamidase/nicotinamidase [Staphylotrichum tortipilum]|uniref:nicotinamidase n=1 Tax=Staphylotrichum tortipilum TaxID=2831512 RepID=A0AAN6RWQ1_9PEZI|nr:Pyrazinamidase/nicotinamidase [Staphylotrichum longicolle]
MADSPDPSFKPALLVIDMQEDFCPPNGTLPVPDARSITPLINTLLALPTLPLKIATQDWHPPAHISFASNHSAPHNTPFTSTTTITNPLNPAESYTTRLWPVHCVAHTPGAALLPELHTAHLTHTIQKGTDPRVEMYSAFYPPLHSPRMSDSGLAALLHGEGITHVYVVGLAGDYCVRSTAEDAVREGFVAYVVEEGTRPVDGTGWEGCKREMEERGVKVVREGGREVGRLFGRVEGSG